ncbi:unnamed protein product [Parnassius apollo]|uniref:Protein-lysine N-methyltransferase SMYD4 n=1 Tax=Parnassius apollo TaxID=110799 RepID=A0A8S3XM76_PARAO|nr:unnamed protein product [Parnassius apollo]
MSELDAFPVLKKVEKSDSVSTYYRNQGNKCFQASEDFKAWQYYNLSLLHASYNSNNYCLALSNRSAVFFSMKKYKECLADIHEIFLMKYPQDLHDKLSKRQMLCQKALLKEIDDKEKHSDFKNILNMQSNRDPRYLCASTKLVVEFNEEMGRQVFAKEDIRVGEILVEEDPYFTLVLKTQYLFSCSYCLSRNLNLLPCKDCCYALYCSDECRINASKDYHNIECPLMASLFDMDFTKLELLALRTVIKARYDHNDWQSFLRTIEEAEANMNNEYRGHIKVNGEWIFDSKHYASIHTLECNIKKRSVSDIFQKSVTAVVFLKFLTEHTNFLQVQDSKLSESVRNCVAATLLLHLMTSPTNMHGISANIQSADGNFVEEQSLASAPYGFHSLINHSCVPNVVRFGKLGSGKMKLFALRPIKKGMQIFDNYGAHHALEDCLSRRASLKFQYKFHCVCEACVNDWPTYLSMRPSVHIPEKLVRIKNKLLNTSVINKLQKGDEETAVKLFKSLCSLCEHFEFYAPCTELSDCQEALKQCLSIFSGLLPYGNKLMIPWSAIPPE